MKIESSGSKPASVEKDRGEIIKWQLTPGNVDDREPLKNRAFNERLFGKLFADRGYISQDLFEMLFVNDIHLETKLKRNMKTSLMNLYEANLLHQWQIILRITFWMKNILKLKLKKMMTCIFEDFLLVINR